MAYCERQWALIHLERAWAENARTVKGRHFHERADDPEYYEVRGSVRRERSVPIWSDELHIQGLADIVEYTPSEHGVQIRGSEQYWMPVPVEYKRGSPKKGDHDAIQLCAQAMCLEEMMSIHIDVGVLYYGETRRRLKVQLTEDLRKRVRDISARMNMLYANRETPPAKKGMNCKSCSLVELCVPKLTKKRRRVDHYIEKLLEEDSE